MQESAESEAAQKLQSFSTRLTALNESYSATLSQLEETRIDLSRVQGMLHDTQVFPFLLPLLLA